MSTPEKFAELHHWADSYWNEHGANCWCGSQGWGPRHHEVTCPYFGWAWEQKARDLLRGGESGDDPAKHLASLRAEGLAATEAGDERHNAEDDEH